MQTDQAVRLFILMVLLLSGGVRNTWAQEEAPRLKPLEELQSNKAPQPRSSAEVVTLNAHMLEAYITPGTAAKAAVEVTINEGWHLNAHEPGLEFFIGTDLTFETNETLSVAEVSYPEADSLAVAFADQALNVYEGQVAIGFLVAASKNISTETTVLAGTLQVQACSDEICLPPASIKLSLPVVIRQAE